MHQEKKLGTVPSLTIVRLVEELVSLLGCFALQDVPASVCQVQVSLLCQDLHDVSAIAVSLGQIHIAFEQDFEHRLIVGVHSVHEKVVRWKYLRKMLTRVCKDQALGRSSLSTWKYQFSYDH